MCNFSTLPVLNDIPSKEDYSDKYKGYELKLVLRQAKKVYLRTRLAEAQNWKCGFCGCEMTPEHNHKNSTTIEHVQPRSLGGKDHEDNYIVTCYKCNSDRSNMDWEVFLYSRGSKNLRLMSVKQSQTEKKMRKYEKKIEKFLKEFGKDYLMNEWLSTIKLKNHYIQRLKDMIERKYIEQRQTD